MGAGPRRTNRQSLPETAFSLLDPLSLHHHAPEKTVSEGIARRQRHCPPTTRFGLGQASQLVAYDRQTYVSHRQPGGNLDRLAKGIGGELPLPQQQVHIRQRNDSRRIARLKLDCPLEMDCRLGKSSALG